VPAGFISAFDGVRGVVVDGGTVFVAGTTHAAGGIFACLVRAYDVRNGRVFWESTASVLCRAQAIATDGRHVLVAGIGGPFPDDYVVQAYDAETGAALWRDRTFVSTGADNEAVAVDTERRRAFAAGWVRWLPGVGEQQAFLVRAYETDTGVLDWEDQFPAPRPFSQQHARDIAASKGRVIAVGVGSGTWLVRAYDAKQGHLVWSDDSQPAGGVGSALGLSGALAVAIEGGRVFVVGSGVNARGDADFIVRAYDAK
jgi:outer membrane protein assembly factor BamB